MNKNPVSSLAKRREEELQRVTRAWQFVSNEKHPDEKEFASSMCSSNPNNTFNSGPGRIHEVSEDVNKYRAMLMYNKLNRRPIDIDEPTPYYLPRRFNWADLDQEKENTEDYTSNQVTYETLARPWSIAELDEWLIKRLDEYRSRRFEFDDDIKRNFDFRPDHRRNVGDAERWSDNNLKEKLFSLPFLSEKANRLAQHLINEQETAEDKMKSDSWFKPTHQYSQIPPKSKTEPLPGWEVIVNAKHFEPHEVDVKLVENCVVVIGEHKEKMDEHGYVARKFTRRYVLPEEVDHNTIKATYQQNGLVIIQAQLTHPQNVRVIPLELAKRL